ncbi:MAG: TolC family protein [Gemmataceae bacterium]
MSIQAARWKKRFLTLLLLPSLMTGPGCTRAFYRNWTDKEVEALHREKSRDPRWNLDGYQVLPDPRARFADPTKADRPPMPPDDPAAKALSPNPQKPGKAGVGLVEGVGYLQLLDHWDTRNRASQNEPDEKDPYERSILEATRETSRELADIIRRDGTFRPEEEQAAIAQGERTFLLQLEQAVELGLINSREYQTRREGVYLAALPVTLERFAFAPQFFAVETYLRERFGAGTAEGRTNRVRWNGTAGFSQLFSTGGLLLLSFANRTVINIGNEPTTSVSTLSLDLIQPLLRGAGRAVTLEPLTQAERNLLYAVRDFARFRQEFFVFIAAGQPAFIPGVQAGVAAISAGTVTTPGTATPFRGLTRPLTPTELIAQLGPGEGARLGVIQPSNATPQGYLSTLGEKAQLINQYRNIQALRRYFNLFQVYLEGGIVNSVQVGQVEQQLLRSQEQILTAQANYRNSLDQLKQQLGLPMNLRIDVDEGPLQPMLLQTRRYEQLSSEFERLSQEAATYAKPGEEAKLRDRLRRLLLEDAFIARTSFPARLRLRWADWEKEPAGVKDAAGRDGLDRRLEKLNTERRTLMTKRDELREKEKDLSPTEAARLEELDFEVELGRLEKALRAYASKFWEAEKDPYRRSLLQTVQFNVAYRQFLALLEIPFGEAREQVRKRWPELPPACIEGVDLLADDDEKVLSTIVRVALENRLDLMNQRAQLVDAWRKITVSANALMAALDVQYAYDVNTPLGAARPLDFGYNRRRHQLIINGELPLVRIPERNIYRAALIGYQQQRRALQQAEDNIAFAVRLNLRRLRAAAVNYHKIQKRNVELAYTQVDQALQAFSQPQAPAGPAAPPGSVGAPAASSSTGDPAALTQQLLQAQNSLLGAINGLYSTWLNYLTTRMSLYRDLGVMPLDSRGVWIDDATTCCPPTTQQHPSDDRGAPDLLPIPGAVRPANPPTGSAAPSQGGQPVAPAAARRRGDRDSGRTSRLDAVLVRLAPTWRQ